jgi:hypothetical protein
MVVPISAAVGVYVVETLVAFANVPAPPVQVPAPFAIAVMFTGEIPQVAYGPCASAIAAESTLTITFAVTVGQGPELSGSTVVHVSVTAVPVCAADGSYVVELLEVDPNAPVPPDHVPPPGVVVTTMFAISLLQIVYGPPGVAVAGVFTVS